MSTWGRIAGIAGIATGVIGAAALGGLSAQRRLVRKHHATASGESIAEPYDLLEADRVYSVVATDGVVLHVEEVGPTDADLTVIFAHGWCLRGGAWHFQRTGLAGSGFGSGRPGPKARMVFYDQRSHGRSTRADDGHSTMNDLADDLAAVIATAAPDGPLVIVGHSMGGMALLTLAGRDPDLFADRVRGIGLISTSASNSGRQSLFSSTGPLLRLLAQTAGRYSTFVERTRAGSKDAIWLVTRAFGFSRKDIPGDLVDYLDEMISAVPIDIISEFAPALFDLDVSDSLPALTDIPTVLICGDSDRLTPLARTEYIAASLPRADLVIVENAGHMAILEAPTEVNDALRRMLLTAAAAKPKRRTKKVAG